MKNDIKALKLGDPEFDECLKSKAFYSAIKQAAKIEDTKKKNTKKK